FKKDATPLLKPNRASGTATSNTPCYSHISLCSWNVRGLNSKFKRAQLFTYLKKYNPTILLLQETHQVGSKILALKKPWVAHHFHAPFSSHARGVATLIQKIVMYETMRVCLDAQGRYVIIQCKSLQLLSILWGILMPCFIPTWIN
uniref:exodeoxyribonuclease III n=1 Tax=Xenopus tropicalis TaxID=8364 RepID=A0A803K4L8_XENTR